MIQPLHTSSTCSLSQLICGLAHCPLYLACKQAKPVLFSEPVHLLVLQTTLISEVGMSHLVALLHFSLFDDLERISHFLKLSHLFVCLMSVFSMLAS